MTAKIIDGKALAARIQDELKTRVEACTEHGHRPGLAVVLVGEDPASQVYVRNKVRACERTGIRSDEIRMPAETTEAELLAVIDRLNHDDAVDGILVQLPLPKHLSSELVIAAISPEKDVDGFHVVSAGSLLTNSSSPPSLPKRTSTASMSSPPALSSRGALVFVRVRPTAS